jgi:intein/homing endonuclease
MADGTTKPIELLEIGDLVLSFDEESGQMKPDRVTKLLRHPKEDTYLIINGHLRVTPIHPVLSKGEWKRIDSLEIGDTLTNARGEDIPIESIDIVKETVDVYNFEVNPYHTYIAGGIVVHNSKRFEQPPCDPLCDP